MAPSLLDVDLVASLPALRKLNFSPKQWIADGVHLTAGKRLLRRALPHVFLQERSELCKPDEFLKWALG